MLLYTNFGNKIHWPMAMPFLKLLQPKSKLWFELQRINVLALWIRIYERSFVLLKLVKHLCEKNVGLLHKFMTTIFFFFLNKSSHESITVKEK